MANALVEREAAVQVEENDLSAFSLVSFDRPVERALHNVGNLLVSLIAVPQEVDFLTCEEEILAAFDNCRKYRVDEPLRVEAKETDAVAKASLRLANVRSQPLELGIGDLGRNDHRVGVTDRR